MKASECTLYSGGLRGAEAAFGEEAERHGVEEVNFTFQGREIDRSRGVRILGDKELKQGDVSLAYVSKIMHRRYPNADYIKRVLQTIWHQVNNAREIYVVGNVLADDTVTGGTGWGAEFAKLCNKPLFVFDQESDCWLHWVETRWEERIPVISHVHFAGTDTRFLKDNGRNAIRDLFDRSF